MAYHGDNEYRSPFGDTTYTKVFVGGLAWETPTEKMREYFEQFGEILEAVIITDKSTGKSKGYGFVTYRDPPSAVQACAEANPMIDGRRANCNIASFGRPRQSPPRGKNQEGISQGQSSSFSGMPAPQQQTLHAPQFYYQPYGYPYTTPYGYQGVYNQQMQQSQQYYAQLYCGGSTPSSSMANPYYYGDGVYPRAGAPTHRLSGTPVYYYPTQTEANFAQFPAGTPNPAASPFLSAASLTSPATITNRQHVHSSAEESQVRESASTDTDAVEIIRSAGPSN